MKSNHNSNASDFIREKLQAQGGRATVYTLQGLPCEIWLGQDEKTLISNKLPITPPYRLEVFDLIVELLQANGGRARKGNGRNYKLGDPHCDDTTVVGYVASHYSRKKPGDSVFDPVFVFAAILEWADIAHNGRGELFLTPAWYARLNGNS